MLREIASLGDWAAAQSDKLGALQPVIGLVIAIALAAVLVCQVVLGKGFLPDIPERATMLRVYGAFSIVGMAFLVWAENSSDSSGFDLPMIAASCIAAAAIGVVAYYLLAAWNLIVPLGWDTGMKDAPSGWVNGMRIVVGPWMTKDARAYRTAHGKTPAGVLAAYGNTPAHIRQVWPLPSLACGWILVAASTAAVNIGLPGTVAALAFDILDIRIQSEQTPETKTLRFPSHFVFASGKSDIADLETSALERELQTIVDFAPSRIEVHGHTDGEGDNADNQPLSEERAASVKTWLEMQDALKDVEITAQGFGETGMRFGEVGLDGRALEDARRGNRRVELLLIR